MQGQKKYSVKVMILCVNVFLYQVSVAQEKQFQFDFYGRIIEVKVAESLLKMTLPKSNIEEKHVNLELKKYEKKQIDAVFQQLEKKSKEMNLDGLGHLQLLKKFTSHVFSSHSFQVKKLMVWLGLRHSGYDCILASSNQFFNLYIRTDYPQDGGFFIQHQGIEYTSATLENTNETMLDILKPNYCVDSPHHAVNFDPYNTPILGKVIKNRKRKFEFRNKEFTLNTTYNASLTQYLDELPSFTVGTYLYTFEPSEEATKSLDDSIKSWIQTLGYYEQIDFLLSLVQNAFAYKADTDYRKSEKRNFIEQSLADDYTDCEDKAALFCYLVNRYLQAETILLYSKEKTHVCCAIQMPKTATGFNFKRHGNPYMICEPAYIGYKPGETELTANQILKLEVFE